MRAKYLPQALLTSQPNVWATFLMKVYYKSVKHTLKHKGREMRECHKDVDWEEVYINFESWLKILDESFIETIIEKRLRKQQDPENYCLDDDHNPEDNVEQLMITKVQMLCVVSELFLLKKHELIRYLNDDEKEVKIRWKIIMLRKPFVTMNNLFGGFIIMVIISTIILNIF